MICGKASFQLRPFTHCNRLLKGVVSTKVDVFVIYLDSGQPAISAFAPLHASVAASVILFHAVISTICFAIRQAKIANPVIVTLAVDMIQAIARPFSIIHGPNHCMRAHILTVNSAYKVAIRIGGKRFFPGKPPVVRICCPLRRPFRASRLARIEHFRSARRPVQLTGIWIADKNLLDPINRRARQSLFSQFQFLCWLHLAKSI